jgi:hypothetical protein
MKCAECKSYDTGECHRYPPTINGFPRVSATSWCGEFNEVVKVEVFKMTPPLPPPPPPEKEVIVCPAVEDEKGSAEKAAEEANKPRHRGWPKGMPRKVAV